MSKLYVLSDKEIKYIFERCLLKTEKKEVYLPKFEFWNLWKKKKLSIKKAGFSVYRKKDGTYLVTRNKRKRERQLTYNHFISLNDRGMFGGSCDKQYIPKKWRPKWTKKR